MLGQLLNLLSSLHYAAIFFSLILVWSHKDLELSALQQVWKPQQLFHELLQMKAALLKELKVFRVTKEAALGELGYVEAV